MDRFKLDPNNLPELTPEHQAHIDALTDDEIDRIAEEDPENPPLSDEQLDRMVAGRDVREARGAAGLSLHAFATALGIPVLTMRNWEESRVMPEPAALALLSLVKANPVLILGMLTPPDAGDGEAQAERRRA